MDQLIRDKLRLAFKKKRQSLSENYIRQYSKKICQRIMQIDEYRKAKHIAIYHAIKGEVSLQYLWQVAPLHGKFCYFPVSRNGKIIFLPATPKTKFKAGNYNILEPQVSIEAAYSLQQLDLILVPLVAFDPFGIRIGMGKGYYDRTFASLSKQEQIGPVRLGVAYQFQYQPILQKQPWDVLLHGTITEQATYWTNKNT